MTSLDELLLIRGQYRYIRKNAIQDFRNSEYVVPFTTEVFTPGGTGPDQYRKIHSKGFVHTGSSPSTIYYPVPSQYSPFVLGIRDNQPTITFNSNNTRRRLVDSYCIFDNDIIGPYKSSYTLPLAPLIESNEAGAQLLEVYAMALLRDVPLSVINSSSINSYMNEIVSDLNLVNVYLGAPTDPLAGNQITRKLLFRENTVGDRIGPYVSQFLYYTILYSNYEFVQNQYITIKTASGFNLNPNLSNVNFEEDFMLTRDVTPGSFVEMWDATTTTDPRSLTTTKRYMTTIRDCAIFINKDQPWQLPYMAGALLMQKNVRLGFFSSPRQGQKFINLGPVDFYDIMSKASKLAMNASWLWKYKQLRVRPEEMAYQLDLTLNPPTVPGLNFPTSLTSNNILNKVARGYINISGIGVTGYLMPQTYRIGSPCHSSQPSGHATIAGAMITILKAWWNCDSYMKAYEPDLTTDPSGNTLGPVGTTGGNDFYLRVGDELDKLASNCGVFRNFAGIHYRGDADTGLDLGEQVAIDLLEDLVKKYSNNLAFRFAKRNGQIVTIKNFDGSLPAPFPVPNPNTGVPFLCHYSTYPYIGNTTAITFDNNFSTDTIASGEDLTDPGETYLDFNQT